MKKFLSILLSALIAFSATGAFAKDIEPSVKVDGRTVVFLNDQAPVIQNDRLYVPVRLVLEQMGAEVNWNDETKTVNVKSKDNITRLFLTIDNPEITTYTFTSVLSADEGKITSDVAPIILNSRTMLPIRVVAEALGATVLWDDASKLTSITTKEAKLASKEAGNENADDADFDYAASLKEGLPKLSLEADSEDVNAGDKVTLSVKVADLSEGTKVTATTISVLYDSENFEYEGFTNVSEGEDADAQLKTDKADFYEGCAKIISLNLPENAFIPGEDGVIMKVTFNALTDNGGSFGLSDGKSQYGYDTELLTVEGEDVLTTLSDANEIFIDTTKIEIK